MFENKDEKNNSRRANSVGIIIYTGRVSKYIKGRYIRKSRIRGSKI